MRTRTIWLSILALTLLASLAMAADVTGKWVANQPGRNGTREVTYNFKADGSKLTGTASGFRGQEMPISDGKIDGDTISFVTKAEFNGNTIVMKYTGKVSDDEIKFSVQREGGDQSREFTAKRAK